MPYPANIFFFASKLFLRFAVHSAESFSFQCVVVSPCFIHCQETRNASVSNLPVNGFTRKYFDKRHFYKFEYIVKFHFFL